MEAFSGGPPQLPLPKFEPDLVRINIHLLKHGVDPSPKITHALRKKEIQKHARRAKRLAEKSASSPVSASEMRALAEESRFQAVRREFGEFSRAVAGKPWEKLERLGFGPGVVAKEGLRREELRELKEVFESRRCDELRWVLDDDVEAEEAWLSGGKRRLDPPPPKKKRSEAEVIRFLVDRICGTKLTRGDWKLPRMMKQSGLEFTEGQLLRIIEGLGSNSCWEQAISVVERVYETKDMKHNKSRFVFTKLMAVLGKARRPHEALKVFNTMLGDFHIYPDMAAYHSIAVTLGQAGHLHDLIKIMECMRQKPSKKTRNIRYKNWDPVLDPDIVIYNAVLNACISGHQWKGVSWVFKEMRICGLKPNGATFGLAMEVMLQSGKYELVHEYFRKMRKSGETPTALTYKVLVRASSCEGKTSEAVEAVRDMERRGVVGASSVYYELACCLCGNGRWEDALLEVDKMKKLPRTKPLEVSFTGMITSSMHGGYIDDCISIFKEMKNHCSPNIGTLNIMMKIYGRNDMFSKAKALFEEVKTRRNSDSCSSCIVPDEYTYNAMLEASANALQWEYFEYVYKEMILSGFQLDHSRYAPLLLEASKAGKWHLLEHAFEALLEAGEIPNPLYFSEMMLQATARNDYERATILINAMALAPFQVSEAQWRELFEKNTDRIGPNRLEKLSASLQNCDVRFEPTVKNLSSVLTCLCEVDSLSGNSVEIARELVDEDSDSDADVDPLLHRNRAKSAANFSAVSRQLDNNYKSAKPKGFSEDKSSEKFGDPMSSKISESSLIKNGEGINEMGIEAMLSQLEEERNSGGSIVPSANEVLEIWKEKRKGDGVLSFRLWQN